MSAVAVTSPPDLALEARDAVRVNGSWRVRWRVTNRGEGHPRLVAMRAPHGRFRSDPVDLNTVIADGGTIVEQTLRVEAAPGEEIERASVIFVVMQERETWRVLFHVRVGMDAEGTPHPIVETMTTHRVGFTEV